jgi:hypothetical protein
MESTQDTAGESPGIPNPPIKPPGDSPGKPPGPPGPQQPPKDPPDTDNPPVKRRT